MAGEDLAYLDPGVSYFVDAADCSLHGALVRCADLNPAVLADLNLCSGLLADGTDGPAALSDNRLCVSRADVDGADLRREAGDALARRAERCGGDAEDMKPCKACLGDERCDLVCRNDSGVGGEHNGGDAALRAGLNQGDICCGKLVSCEVREDRAADDACGDAGCGALHADSGVHERKGKAGYRGNGNGAVSSDDLDVRADLIGEAPFLLRKHRKDGGADEGADPAGVEALVCGVDIGGEALAPVRAALGVKSNDGEGLDAAVSEECGAVDAGDYADARAEGCDHLSGAAVLPVPGLDAVADDAAQGPSREHSGSRGIKGEGRICGVRLLGDNLRADGALSGKADDVDERVIALPLGRALIGAFLSLHRICGEGLHELTEELCLLCLIRGCGDSGASGCRELADGSGCGSNRLLGELNGCGNNRIAGLCGAALGAHGALSGSGNDEIKGAQGDFGADRVQDELAVDEADPRCRERSEDRKACGSRRS